jgi:hypothetical protein
MTCFCASDKKLKISCLAKLYYCTCPEDPSEPLIRLECCGNYVHKSCFDSYLISQRDAYIYGDNYETNLEESIFTIDKCYYCNNPPIKYVEKFSEQLPYSNLEESNINTFSKFKKYFERSICIFIIYSCVIGLFDIIFAHTHMKHNIIDYCNNFDDKSKCEQDIRSIGAYKYIFFGSCIIWGVGIACFLAFLVYLTDDKTDDLFTDFFGSYYTPWYKSRFYHREPTNVKKYRCWMDYNVKLKNTLLSCFSVSILLLIWQFVYLGLSLYYNLLYVPNEKPETITDINDILIVYVKIFTTCNIYVVVPVGFIILGCCGGICLKLVFCCKSIYEESFNACFNGCFNSCKKYKNNRKNLGNLGNYNTKIFELDNDPDKKKKMTETVEISSVV